MTHYSAFDSKGACLREADTLDALLAGFIHDGEMTLQAMPEVARIEVSIDDLCAPDELPQFMLKNFNDDLADGCEWEADESFTDLAGRKHYASDYGA